MQHEWRPWRGSLVNLPAHSHLKIHKTWRLRPPRFFFPLAAVQLPHRLPPFKPTPLSLPRPEAPRQLRLQRPPLEPERHWPAATARAPWPSPSHRQLAKKVFREEPIVSADTKTHSRSNTRENEGPGGRVSVRFASAVAAF
eukprot:GHVT01079542.1.p1 GENE.GHVT01079542.1~~GHVT01079542.1.p1  ORF type:complete len:141 (-),score=24.76 GHVT01079542.1:650-1072(-)